MKKLLPIIVVGAIIGYNAILLELNASGGVMLVINMMIALILTAIILVTEKKEEK